jgi:hypothetical protein
LALQHSAFSLTALGYAIGAFRSGTNFAAFIKTFTPTNAISLANFGGF